MPCGFDKRDRSGVAFTILEGEQLTAARRPQSDESEWVSRPPVTGGGKPYARDSANDNESRIDAAFSSRHAPRRSAHRTSGSVASQHNFNNPGSLQMIRLQSRWLMAGAVAVLGLMQAHAQSQSSSSEPLKLNVSAA